MSSAAGKTMCGIAGAFAYADHAEPPSEAVGLRMAASLNHRGPDDGGLVIGPKIVLGHRRLSILDTSDCGHQPMSDPQGRFWLAYNGEIYNFRELRSELEARGCPFRSSSDTEVVLYALREWGEAALPRFNGMFALALWDASSERLLLARDPVGIKPLFYQDDGRRLRFGSEIKAILADPAALRMPDLAALDAFLSFSYTPAPATGFVGVRQLLPGQCLTADARGIRLSTGCELPLPQGPRAMSEREAVERLRQSIDSAVARQMVSDVPLGALLSGGLDSSAVVRAMQSAGTGETLTFSIGFGEESFDESPYARRVAEILGTRHHDRRVEADAAALLPRLVSHAEEPFADNSMLPFFLLAQFTRERVTVALSGDGADELLAGYSTYRASRLARWYRRLPAAARRHALAPLIHRLPPSTRKYGVSMLLSRFVEGADLPPPRDHCSWRQTLSPRWKRILYAPAFDEALGGSDPIGQYAAAIESAPAWADELERLLHGDLTFHLPNDMLVKVDRMSMAHSLEVRVPLLDLEMIRCCREIPSRWKLRGRAGKHALRKSLEDALPREILRRPKAGFVAPIESWLRGPLQPMLREFLSDPFLRQMGLLRPEPVRRMIDDHGQGRRNHAYELFALLALSLWWRIWIDRSLPVACNSPQAAPAVVRRLSQAGAVS